MLAWYRLPTTHQRNTLLGNRSELSLLPLAKNQESGPTYLYYPPARPAHCPVHLTPRFTGRPGTAASACHSAYPPRPRSRRVGIRPGHLFRALCSCMTPAAHVQLPSSNYRRGRSKITNRETLLRRRCAPRAALDASSCPLFSLINRLLLGLINRLQRERHPTNTGLSVLFVPPVCSALVL